MKKVLVIGGTGTISTPVTLGLANDENVELYVLNRGNRKNSLPENVHQLKGDIRNVDEVRELLKDLEFDSVINFILMTIEDARANYEIFNGKTRQFIFISTVCALDHTVSCNVDEKMPWGNRYYEYGRRKEECERYFLKQYEENGFPVTIVRPTQTYSDSRYPLSLKGKTYWSVASRMLRGKEVIVHGDGQGVWACTHATDFARLFNPLVGNDKTIGETYQVMNPEPCTWDMIYQALADALGVEYKPVYISEYLLDQSKTYDFRSTMHGDKHFSCIFDISKVRSFSPDVKLEIDIRKGAQMYVEYMNAHPEEKKEDEDFDRWCDRVIEKYHELEKEFTEVL